MTRRGVALVMLATACASTACVSTACVSTTHARGTVGVTRTARDEPEWTRGRNLLVGGIGLATIGGVFVGFSPLEIAGGSPTGPETVAVGVGLGALGATLIVLGHRIMRHADPAP